MSQRYNKAKRSRLAKGDTNNCSVIALSIACRVPYNKAHTACAQVGRKNGRGLHTFAIIKAAELLGCEVTRIVNRGNEVGNCRLTQPNGSRYTAKTVGKKAKAGYFLAFVSGHVFSVVNSQVEDWTEGRRHNIKSLYRVTVPKGSRS